MTVVGITSPWVAIIQHVGPAKPLGEPFGQTECSEWWAGRKNDVYVICSQRGTGPLRRLDPTDIPIDSEAACEDTADSSGKPAKVLIPTVQLLRYETTPSMVGHDATNTFTLEGSVYLFGCI
jgi:hypothetical protein